MLCQRPLGGSLGDQSLKFGQGNELGRKPSSSGRHHTESLSHLPDSRRGKATPLSDLAKTQPFVEQVLELGR